MEPYTVQGLAKAEGQSLHQRFIEKTISISIGMSVMDESTGDDSKLLNNGNTQYKLVGIIVHSGQANGGHYYSFVQNKYEGVMN